MSTFWQWILLAALTLVFDAILIAALQWWYKRKYGF